DYPSNYSSDYPSNYSSDYPSNYSSDYPSNYSSDYLTLTFQNKYVFISINKWTSILNVSLKYKIPIRKEKTIIALSISTYSL
ncbi:hypothetical protein ACQVQF_21325, partial [Bacillus cereus]